MVLGTKLIKFFFLQSDEDKANFQKLIEEIKQSDKGKTLGVFIKDNYPGAFMDGWRNALKKEDFETIDMSAAFAYLTSPKEESEIITIKKSSQISVDVFNKYLKDQIMEIIDSEKVRLGFFLVWSIFEVTKKLFFVLFIES